MKNELYSLSLSADQAKILYDAVAESLASKRLFDEDDCDIANLEALLERLELINLSVRVNKAQSALIERAKDGK